jgi:glycosyltransferase-like protein
VEAAIVPNGVDGRRFSPRPDGQEEALRRRLGLGPGPVLLTVGGVEPRKNSIALLRAFLSLWRERPSAQLVIAGGASLFDHGPYQREFAAVAQEAGLLGGGQERPPLVHAGVLPDAEMPALYRLADAFVFPSVREGWGISLLEAMASGAPVVSSAHPPFTEFLMHGEDALLVDPRDPAAIAGAAAMILDDPDLAGRLRPAAIATAARYTWERSARAALALYRDFLATPVRPPGS